MPELDLQLTNSLPWEKEKQAAFLGHVLDLSSADVLLRVKDRISPAWFLDGYAGKLYGLWCKFYDQNQRTPASQEEFLHWDDLCGISTPDRIKYKNVMNQASVLKTHFGLDLMQKELTDWLRCRIYHERVEKSAKFFNSRNVTGAVSVLEEAVREFNSTQFDGNTACDWDLNQIMNQISVNTEKALTFGHPLVDKVLCPESPGGGLLLGDMTLLIAPTGVGKTSVMITVATRNAMQGRHVLYVGLEGNYLDLQEKFWMSFTDTSRTDLRIKAAKHEPDLKKIFVEQRHSLQKYLTYVDIDASSSPSVEDILGVIRQHHSRHRSEHGQGYDLVIVDYPGVLTLKSLSNIRMENRDALARIYWHFSQLAKSLNVHVLAAVQTNRDASRRNRNVGGGDNSVLTLEDVSESFGVTHCAANILTVNRSDEAKKGGMISFYVSKCRSARDGITISCRSKYSVCRTHDPSMHAVLIEGGVVMAGRLDAMLTNYNGGTVPQAYTISRGR
jgi:KaiC/GvpD/RAD55 family RecA-like ATPase